MIRDDGLHLIRYVRRLPCQPLALPAPAPLPVGGTVCPPAPGVQAWGWIIDPIGARAARAAAYAAQRLAALATRLEPARHDPGGLHL